MKPFLCACCLSASLSCHAVVMDAIEIPITGRITDSTCEVALADTSKNVPMGVYLVQNFKQVNDTSAPVDFTIQLENCGTETQQVSVEFTGTGAGDGSLLALNDSSVSQLAIQLLDKNKSPIALNDSTNGGRLYVLTPGAAQQTLLFYAQYVALTLPLEAGEADASAKLSLTWP